MRRLAGTNFLKTCFFFFLNLSIKSPSINDFLLLVDLFSDPIQMTRTCLAACLTKKVIECPRLDIRFWHVINIYLFQWLCRNSTQFQCCNWFSSLGFSSSFPINWINVRLPFKVFFVKVTDFQSCRSLAQVDKKFLKTVYTNLFSRHVHTEEDHL